MVGNPCTDWEYFKDYCVARLDNLGRIEGEDVSKSWRLQAKQNLPDMEKKLVVAAR